MDLRLGRCEMGFGDSLRTIIRRMTKRGKGKKIRRKGLKFGKNGRVWRKEW